MAGKNSVNQCSVGQHMKSQCYSSRFVPEDFSLYTLDDLDEETRKTVHFRSNMKIASKNGAIHVYPGKQLCVTSYKQLLHISNELEVKSTSESSSKLGDLETALEDIVSDDAFSSPLTSPENDLRRSTLITNTLKVTPITIAAKRSKERRNPDIARKAEQVKNAFILLHKNHIDDSLVTTATSTATSSEKNTFSVLDYTSQMYEIRQKCMQLKMEGKVKEVISLLTLALVSWSKEVTADYFSVTVSEVKRARLLKQEKGILAVPDPKKGRKITPEEIEIVEEFYLSDEFSRLMPGMNDYISVRLQDGEKKTKIQKR
ncbi:Cc8L18.2-like protein, partial [Daphnia magna]